MPSYSKTRNRFLGDSAGWHTAKSSSGGFLFSFLAAFVQQSGNHPATWEDPAGSIRCSGDSMGRSDAMTRDSEASGLSNNLSRVASGTDGQTWLADSLERSHSKTVDSAFENSTVPAQVHLLPPKALGLLWKWTS